MLDRSTKSGLRAVAPLTLPDVVPNATVGTRPMLRDVDPESLLIDEAYQRELSERSIALIRRIVAEWDWKAFKPPIVAEIDGSLHVIDGQHTTIAAASHPGIASIPIMVVEAGAEAGRAEAFVRHNRDRLGITVMQLHASLVAAGDADAVTAQQVCDRAGATLLRMSRPQARFKPGDIIAIKSVYGLCNRRHARGARMVIEVCANAKLAPIDVHALRAVEELLFAEQYKGTVLAEDITTALIGGGTELRRKAISISTEKFLPQWKALTIALFTEAKKVRRGSKTS